MVDFVVNIKFTNKIGWLTGLLVMEKKLLNLSSKSLKA